MDRAVYLRRCFGVDLEGPTIFLRKHLKPHGFEIRKGTSFSDLLCSVVGNPSEGQGPSGLPLPFDGRGFLFFFRVTPGSCSRSLLASCWFAWHREVDVAVPTPCSCGRCRSNSTPSPEFSWNLRADRCGALVTQHRPVTCFSFRPLDVPSLRLVFRKHERTSRSVFRASAILQRRSSAAAAAAAPLHRSDPHRHRSDPQRRHLGKDGLGESPAAVAFGLSRPFLGHR